MQTAAFEGHMSGKRIVDFPEGGIYGPLFVAMHPEEAAGGRFCRLPNIRQKGPLDLF